MIDCGIYTSEHTYSFLGFPKDPLLDPSIYQLIFHQSLSLDPPLTHVI